MVIYDTIIIGAGISGLYTAYKIMKMDKNHKMLILESEDYIGGRAFSAKFSETIVPTGAGVGRKKKDKLLLKLLKELNIEITESKHKTIFSDKINHLCEVKNIFKKLSEIYKNNPQPNQTFKEFAVKHIGMEKYNMFKICAGYTDYEKAAVEDVIYDYGFDDNYETWSVLYIPWNQLIKSLKEACKTSIVNNQTVTNIRTWKDNDNKVEKLWSIYTNNNGSLPFLTKRIIIATNINTVKKIIPKNLVPKINNENLLNIIHGQPFLRTYGSFSGESKKILDKLIPHTIIVPGPLHKIIPMSSTDKKSIFMIAYSDNEDAMKLKKYKDDKTKMCKILEKTFELDEKLVMDDIVSFYWDIGTHYFAPSEKINIPRNDFIEKVQFIRGMPDGESPRANTPNIFIVGEMISRNQGWVEGALESVENILRFL